MNPAPIPSENQPIRRIVLGVLAVTALGLAAALGRCSYMEWIANPYRSDSDWSLLPHAPTDTNGPSVEVGPNHHVSHEYPDEQHLEVVALHAPTADGESGAAGRLVIASMYLGPGEAQQRRVRVFASLGGGKDWRRCHEVAPVMGDGVHDPTLAADADGNVLLATMDATKGTAHRIALARLDATSDTWSDHTLVEADLDRPWIEIDASTPSEPVLWLLAQRNEVFLHSFDARDLTPLARYGTRERWVSARPARPVFRPGSSPVLVAQNRYPVWRERLRMCVPQIHVLAPAASGALDADAKIGGAWRGETDWPARPASNTPFPALAGRADAARFASHVYCVWAAQATQSPDDERILFSRSTDSGTTWDAPMVLSENEAPEASANSFLAFMPAVHVNRNGVVGVTWYDRRGLPPCTTSQVDEHMVEHAFAGQNVRFRASIDGGESFLPSVQVNDQRSEHLNNLGHTQGLTSSPDGRFHAVWVDRRDGIEQVYSAAVRIGD